jgi:hypothetical protein
MAGRITRQPELIQFTPDDRRAVIEVMRRLLHDRDGWLNLQPAVDPDELPDTPPVLERLFTAKGPRVPLGSWVPGERKRNGTVEPVSLGLQHGGGPKAIPRLRELGLGPRAGWRVLSDNPRRGFVVLVPDDEDPEVALTWLVDAARALTGFDLPATWVAGVFRTG